MIVLELLALGIVAVAAFYYFHRAWKGLKSRGFDFGLLLDRIGGTIVCLIFGGTFFMLSEDAKIDLVLFLFGIGILIDIFRYKKLRHRWP